MKRYHWLVIPLALLFVLGISPAPAAPQPPARAYFDVNLGLADKLETRLMLINTTFDQLSAQGLAPQFVVGFRGPASFFVTTGMAMSRLLILPPREKFANGCESSPIKVSAWSNV